MMKDDENDNYDAALVDAYFLPGGLFNQILTDQSSARCHKSVASADIIADESHPIHIPSNPWEAAMKLPSLTGITTAAAAAAAQTTTTSAPILTTKQVMNAPAVSLVSSVNNDNDTVDNFLNPHCQFQIYEKEETEEVLFSFYNKSKKVDKKTIIPIIRPPPGFDTNPTNNFNGPNAASSSKIHRTNGNHNLSCSTKFLAPRNSSSFMKQNVGGDTSQNLLDPTIARLDLSQESPQQLPQKKNTRKQIGDNIEVFEKNDPRYIKSSKNRRNSRNRATIYNTPEDFMSSITIGGTKASISCKSIDFIDDYNDDHDKKCDGKDLNNKNNNAHNKEGKEKNQNSFPAIIRRSFSVESNVSSMSTCSEVDTSSFSSHTSNNTHQYENVEYDTDQAHVSQVGDIFENSSHGKENSENASDQSISPSLTQSPVYPPEGSLDRKCTFNNISGQQRAVAFLWSIFEYFSEAIYQGIGSISSRIRKLSFCLSIESAHAMVSQHIIILYSEVSKITNWLKAVEGIFAAYIQKWRKKSDRSVVAIKKVRMIAYSIGFKIINSCILESQESVDVTICYATFYIIPKLSSLLMGWFNVPHWTHHIVTLITVFPLCYQVEMNNNHTSINNLADQPARQYSTGKYQQQSQQQEQHRDEKIATTRPQDENFCRNILRILRFVLPILFIADGFSSQSSSIIGAGGSSQLTTAYMMSLIRRNILSSPVGWLSWSLQVVLATYQHSWYFLDCTIVLIGLSSIRLIRYLDTQRGVQRKRLRRRK